MEKILLIDGNLLLFRSFYAAYAFSKQVNNLPTHLFLNSIIEVIKQESPSYIFVAFDANEKTKRHIEYPNYKSGRISPPIEIYEQKQIIISLLELAKIKWFEQGGDEADDLIATLCTKYCDQYQIIIFSEDKDLYQLVDENISILIKNKNAKIGYKKITINNFYDEMKIYPNQIIDFKAIAGDSSDNLKGIKGIGKMTAIELLNKYKTLENIYNNLNELSKVQQIKFIEWKDEAFLCKKLATLNRLVVLNFSLKDIEFDFKNFYNQEFLIKLKENNLNKLFQIFSNNDL